MKGYFRPTLALALLALLVTLAAMAEVNAKIPAGVGTGPVSVVVSVGGVPSQSNVTVSVR